LKEKRLTEIKDSPEILKWVQEKQADDVAHGKSLENGYPLKCYEMTLTDVGWNVKTALIRNVSAAFHAPR
jgi:hypothetical protein